MVLVTHRVGLLRNLVAAVLYGVAAASLLAGFGLGQLAAASRARNAATGDFAGSAMAMSAVIGWCLPLALGAILLAMHLRTFPRAEPDGSRMGPDRRLLRGLDRMNRGPRRVLAASLAGAFLAVAAVLVYLNRLPWSASVWSDPSKPTAVAIRDWVLMNLLYLGPLLLLALAFGTLALRLMRDGPAAEQP